jgi:hypothetical protein
MAQFVWFDAGPDRSAAADRPAPSGGRRGVLRILLPDLASAWQQVRPGSTRNCRVGTSMRRWTRGLQQAAPARARNSVVAGHVEGPDPDLAHARPAGRRRDGHDGLSVVRLPADVTRSLLTAVPAAFGRVQDACSRAAVAVTDWRRGGE